MIDTIDYFIQHCEGELEGLSWEIREESNFEDNAIDFLSEQYDEHKQRLEDLRQIKSIIEENE
jgi:hypothetical protein